MTWGKHIYAFEKENGGKNKFSKLPSTYEIKTFGVRKI